MAQDTVGGEPNTASNIGTGAGVFAQKVGVDLRLRSVKSTDADLAVAETADEIQLSGAGTSAPTASRTVKRDADGRAQVEDPAAAKDIANKGYLEAFISTLEAALAADETTPTAYGDITGVSVTLNKAGRWLIMASVHIKNGSNGGTTTVRLLVNGAAQNGEAWGQPAANGNVSIYYQWLYTAATAGLVAKLQADTDVGLVTTKATDTKITAIYLGA